MDHVSGTCVDVICEGPMCSVCVWAFFPGFRRSAVGGRKNVQEARATERYLMKMGTQHSLASVPTLVLLFSHRVGHGGVHVKMFGTKVP